MSDNRVLVIGLDGGTWDVFDRYAHVMPTLQGLKENATWGVLRSTFPPITAPAWSTFLTGKNPGKHGIFYFTAFENGRVRAVNSLGIQGETFYEIASRQGKRVVSLNLPMTYPPRPINGVVLTGMLTPIGAADFVWPAEARGRFGGYEAVLLKERRQVKVQPWFPAARFPRWRRRFHQALCEVMEARAELFGRLMDELDWDVFVACFTATDRLQHQCWMTIDGQGTEGWRPEEAALIERFYAQLDGHLAALTARMDERTSLVIVSDHGFGPYFSKELKTVRLNRWLAKQGFLDLNVDAPAPDARRRTSLTQSLRGLLKRMIPAGMRRRLRSLLKAQYPAPHRQVNWGGSWAFTVAQGATSYACVFLNPAHPLSGDPANTERLVESLRELADPETGEPIISQLYRAADVYSGDCVDMAPDITFTTRWPWCISDDLAGPVYDRCEEAGMTTREGGHRMEGLLLACGPAFASAGACERSIEDIAPTILNAAGLPAEGSMDGRSFAVNAQVAPTESERPQPGQRRRSEWKDASQERSVKDRLRDLGYM